MKVSIIIPVYNVEEFIERCARSLFEQTYENIEYIFVNDCTKDKSMDILNEIIAEYPLRKDQIKIVIHELNKGLSSSRNTGIENSKGEYLYFVDSDDKISNNAIFNLVNLAIKYHPNFVLGGIDVQGSFRDISLPLSHGEVILTNEKILSSFLKEEWYVMAWNKLIQKSFLIKNKLFFQEGIYHEDLLWSFLLALKAESMAICTEKTYTYYIRENSISTVVRSKNVNDLTFIYNNLVQIVQGDQRLIENRDIIAYLESTRFYILLLCKQKKFWREIKEKMTSVKKISLFSLLTEDLSLETKLKYSLQLFPSTISYCLFLVWKKKLNR